MWWKNMLCSRNMAFIRSSSSINSLFCNPQVSFFRPEYSWTFKVFKLKIKISWGISKIAMILTAVQNGMLCLLSHFSFTNEWYYYFLTITHKSFYFLIKNRYMIMHDLKNLVPKFRCIFFSWLELFIKIE